jgi:hypothetical protein
MAHTRQLRLNEPALIRQKLTDSMGKMMHIVLRDNRVLIGSVHKADADGITLLNMRQKNMKIGFHQISEIYFDTIA